MNNIDRVAKLKSEIEFFKNEIEDLNIRIEEK